MKNLLMATAALAFVIGASETLADDRRGNDRGRGYERSWDRGFTPPGHAKGWSRRDDRDRTRVSINVNLNDRWRPAYRPYNNWNNWNNTRNSFGYSIGFGSWGSGFSAWSAPAPVYRQRQPVVVYQNTWIDQAPRTTTTLRSGTSLLRDINGRCFERSFDSYGNETRVELPGSACNF